MGRRNWLFFGSDNGGKTAAVLKSFIASCQQSKVKPRAYLCDVLTRIAEHPVSALEELVALQLETRLGVITLWTSGSGGVNMGSQDAYVSRTCSMPRCHGRP